MNNNAVATRQGPLPDLKSLIKPEHIRQWSSPRFPEEQKDKYIDGVTKLWHILDNQNPNTEEYRKAHEKLTSVTMNIRATMQRPPTNTAAGSQQTGVLPQQNGPRPAIPGQQVQQDARPPPQNTQTGGAPNENPQFSQRVIAEVRKLNIVAPPNLNGNEGAIKAWVRDAQTKYALGLQRLEGASSKIAQLHQVANNRIQQNKPLDQRENENYRGQIARLEQTQRDSKQILQTFTAQQDAYKRQGGSSGTVQLSSQIGNAGAQSQDSNVGTGGSTKIKQEPQGPSQTAGTAVDAARNQANSTNRSAMTPHTTGQPPEPSITQLPSSRPQTSQGATSHAHPALNINTSSRLQDQPHTSPHVAPSQPSQPSNMSHEPVPHSLDAAVNAARQFSQPNIPQQTPQSATQLPSDQRNSSLKMPIPKDMNLPPPQPVSVGPSRPTLTNGPMAIGPMGQPAIQKHPGFVLEGEGERVLSKKKLEELVRQVTGSVGGEGEEGEGLTAEVEETLLQVADDFVDQVIVAACRLAKLRQSSTLELRDLQLILERNYNIRVPGYASDELRTVKKVIPAQAWTQKLSAVQAAKVTGGKGDL